MRSGEVAEAAGVNVQTLRYYERRGLLAEPERSNGGHRLYSEEVVTVLRVIKAAQRLGFTLEEVAELLEAGRHRHGRPVAGLQERAAAELAEVDAKIADHHRPLRTGRGGGGAPRRPDCLRIEGLLPHPLHRPGRGEPPCRTLLLTPRPHKVPKVLAGLAALACVWRAARSRF